MTAALCSSVIILCVHPFLLPSPRPPPPPPFHLYDTYLQTLKEDLNNIQTPRARVNPLLTLSLIPYTAKL